VAPSPDPRLILFDIDQTLMYTAGAGMRCMRRAIREVTGLELDHVHVEPDGKTDPLILHEVMQALGFDRPGVEVEVWQRYAGHLGDELSRADERRTLKPGVPALLEQLSSRPDIYLGILTGNLEATARIKLDAFELTRYFPIGAYGSDSPDRCALGHIALQRAQRYFGVAFEPARCWVVGDTCRDVAAARALGSRALAVATGSASVADLQACGADVVYADLANTAAVMGTLAT
jgi:phosphoglycolate phosphatase-like HAD superfamily hydrolase